MSSGSIFFSLQNICHPIINPFRLVRGGTSGIADINGNSQYSRSSPLQFVAQITLSASSASRGAWRPGPLLLLKLAKKRWPLHRATGFASHRGPPMGKFLDPLLHPFGIMKLPAVPYIGCTQGTAVVDTNKYNESVIVRI